MSVNDLKKNVGKQWEAIFFVYHVFLTTTLTLFVKGKGIHKNSSVSRARNAVRRPTRTAIAHGENRMS